MLIYVFAVGLLLIFFIICAVDACEKKKLIKELPFLSVLLIIIGFLTFVYLTEPESKQSQQQVNSSQSTEDLQIIKDDVKSIKESIDAIKDSLGIK